MPSSRNRSIHRGFQADMVLVCHVDRAKELKNTKDDWLVESAMVSNESTNLVVLFTQGETDIKDTKKYMELDVQYPVTDRPNANRRSQMRQMYGYAYPVLEDAKTQIFPDMNTLPKKVMDRVGGLLPKEFLDKLIEKEAQLYVRAKRPKLRK